jgi:hypothetical protein
MHDAIKAEIDEVIDFAIEAPEPPLTDVYTDISVAPHIPQE